MLSPIDRMRHAQIWSLLDQYADIREHLEDVFYALQMLQSQLVSDLNDLSADFDDLAQELNNCSKSLIRFKTAPDPPDEDSPGKSGPEVELPFPDDDKPFPFFPETDDSDPFPWDCTEEERR